MKGRHAAALGVAQVAIISFLAWAVSISAQQPGPEPAPAPKLAGRKHFAGAKPSPRHKLIAAPRYVPKRAIPASYGTVPAQLSYWGNDQYGDCVSAEEAFAKACYAVQGGVPEVFVPEATVVSWARKHGFLNGADLTSVMDAMARSGMVASDGKTYTDGPYQAVDFTNYTTLCTAITEGPVKLGIASSQLDPVVGVVNGWIATGFKPDQSEDHCVALCGYGTMQQMAALVGAHLPPDVNPQAQGFLMFTWDTIGVIDNASMLEITGEAWVRVPTTPQTPAPNPPAPPGPNPPPATYSYALTGGPAGAAIDSKTGIFTWAVPATQGPGTVTVSFDVANSAGKTSASFEIVVAAGLGVPVVQAIPQQGATAGTPFVLDLSKFVGAGKEAPAAPKADSKANPR